MRTDKKLWRNRKARKELARRRFFRAALLLPRPTNNLMASRREAANHEAQAQEQPHPS
jgi:hypothetical protein